MKRLLITIIMSFLFLISRAQDDEFCWTPDMDTTEFYNLPWFDNNQLLEDFLDSIGYPNPSMRVMEQGIKYRIPIKFWIYRMMMEQVALLIEIFKTTWTN
jgi:hypothetical protein